MSLISFRYRICLTFFLIYYIYFFSNGQLVGPESWHFDVPVSVLLKYMSASNGFSVCMFLSYPFFLPGRRSCSLE